MGQSRRSNKTLQSLEKILPQSHATVQTFSLREGNSNANCFNIFFSAIGTKLENFRNNPEVYVQKCPISQNPPFKFTEISLEFVDDQLQSLH